MGRKVWKVEDYPAWSIDIERRISLRRVSQAAVAAVCGKPGGYWWSKISRFANPPPDWDILKPKIEALLMKDQ
jgi:hypothetical protein